jgi:hypothetical protein
MPVRWCVPSTIRSGRLARECSEITRAGSGAGAGRSLMTAAAAEIKSTREEPENHVARRERRRRCLPASARLPARKMPAPRGGSAAGAAALMVGTEQWAKADEHDRPHVRLPVLPLALGGPVPTDVHSRSSIATSDPVAFSAQSIRLRDTPQFTLKGAVSD